ncbi:IS3 family transposase [Brevibacillus agri]|uniref:IS3 family transposase n=1 Tax=Brevibacillus TaxID=55080 RepID=UPI0010094614|nr:MULTISPECIES: IS3 family transposase [Brevibacillus]QAV11629.1 IS3 family transposase [Brevibacillus agri]QHZ58993.1 IS3 family transposase [Brevibacillus sp. NSP2.1]
MQKRERRSFTDEFKQQMVQLYENGKPRADILREYDLSASAFDRWVKQSRTTGSFKEKDNRTEEQNELLALRKEIQRLKMENDIFKASSADLQTKITVIRQNAHKYSVSAMCTILQVNRSTYYYESNQQSSSDDEVEQAIIRIFKENQRVYGARKIKATLQKEGRTVSKRRIGRLMKKNGLVSVYTVAQYKPHKSSCNDSPIQNELNREFTKNEPLEAVVSDLTYVRVTNKWHYICLLVDLFNREIIGYSCGKYKDAALVYQAFASVKGDLRQIQLFHTDRGSEFKNQTIDEVIHTFEIKRSLSMKGCPYDNAVAEATFKLIKAEFVKNRQFESLTQLKLELEKYVKWFNETRIHSTLGYLSPLVYKQKALKKSV